MPSFDGGRNEIVWEFRIHGEIPQWPDLEETIRRSRLPSLERTVELILANQDDLATFLSEDERGQLVPEFLRLVTHQLESEHERILRAVRSLVSAQ